MTVGPYRVLPARVRAGMDYLSYAMSIEHGCGEQVLARELDADERRTKRNVLRMMDQWFLGESELADVLLVAQGVSEELIDDVLENGEQLIMGDDDGDDLELETEEVS